MYSDEIIAEVWNNRDTYAAKHHHDMKQIIEDLKNRQKTPYSIIVDQRTHDDDNYGQSGNLRA